MALPFEHFSVETRDSRSANEHLGAITARQDNTQFMSITGRNATRGNVVENGVLTIDPLPTADRLAMNPRPYQPDEKPTIVVPTPTAPPTSDTPTTTDSPTTPMPPGLRLWTPAPECSTPIGENPELDEVRYTVCTGAGIQQG